MSVLLISRTPLLTRSLAPTLSLHPRLLSTSKKARSPLVLYETSPAGVTTLTMNNPKKLNGWTEPMMYAMRDAFEKVASDSATKVVIFTAAQEAPHYYCAGVDLSGTIKPMPFQDLHLMIKEANQAVFEQFLKCPKPVIAAVNGPAIGASVTTATLSDAIIAADSASFNTPFTRLGVTPEGCSSVHFEFLMGKETAERMLGAENYIPTGAEAAEIGLVDQCVPLSELLPTAHKLAEKWISEGGERLTKRSHRGRDDTAHLIAVNEQESKDLADAFLSVKFLDVQATFLAEKGKTVPSMVFKALIATRPIWSNFYTPYAK